MPILWQLGSFLTWLPPKPCKRTEPLTQGTNICTHTAWLLLPQPHNLMDATKNMHVIG